MNTNMIRGRLPFFLKIVAFFALLLFLINHFLPTNNGPFHTFSRAWSSRSSNLDHQDIPQKVWQTWHTPAILLGEAERERARTWQDRNPHYQYELLTDHGAESYVRRHFADDPLIRDTFLNLTDNILRADVMRYLVLAVEGGVYADLDVVCQEPIDTWIPPAFRGKTGVVIGVENDRMPVENDANLYYDYRKYIWGINNWTFMCKAGHPFMRFVAQSVTRNLLEMARKQYRTIATMKLSYKEVIDSTGPRAFSDALAAYATRVTGKKFTHKDATMLEEPKLIDDILILPIRAMSMAEAEREGVEGAHSRDWPAVVLHLSVGSWKGNHVQRPEDRTAAKADGEDRNSAEAEAEAQPEGGSTADGNPTVEGAAALASIEENAAAVVDPAVEAVQKPVEAQAAEDDQANKVDTPIEGSVPRDLNPPIEVNPPTEINLAVEGNAPVEANSPVEANPPVEAVPPVEANPPVEGNAQVVESSP